MSVKRSINTSMWADGWFETISPIQKLVWIYLLTNSYTNMLGIYKVSIKRIIFETGLTGKQISDTLESFERIGKAFYWFNEWIFLPNWIKNQSMNGNMIKSAIQNFNELPIDLKNNLLALNFESFESLSNGYLMLPNIEDESERESECKTKEYIHIRDNVKLTQSEIDNITSKYGSDGLNVTQIEIVNVGPKDYRRADSN